MSHTQIKALVIAFQEAGNPFDEDSDEVVIIDTREVSGNRHKNRNKSKHVDSTKEDMRLLGQLYKTMHVMEGNSDRLSEVENAGCPRNWNRYLQNASTNKVEASEPFHYPPVAIAQTVFCEGKVVISTLDENVLGSPVPGGDESEYPLRPCNHAEFDTRSSDDACSECSIARE